MHSSHSNATVLGMDHVEDNTSSTASKDVDARPENAKNIRDAAMQQYCNDGALSVYHDAAQGSYVVANRTLQPQEVLLSCPSASIAMDPMYRSSHCGFCARPLQNQHERTSPCQTCHLVTICQSCHEHGATEWHSQNGGECSLLLACVESFRHVFAEFEGLTLVEAAQNVESIYILTMRLLNRRHQQYQQKPQITCPLPDIDWELFDSLYTSPLPSSAGASAVVTAMATLLKVMNLKLQDAQQIASVTNNKDEQAVPRVPVPQPPLDPAECISIWNKCRGCCHAITDMSRPLGAQNLGMALFIPQSFYNHSCAPNAFLSCLLAGQETERALNSTSASTEASTTSESNALSHTDSTTKNHDHFKCSVISQVVLCSDTALAKGSPVTLSYIPLSGLCRQERKVRLQDTYHFECGCQICQEAANALTGSDGFVLEQNVGGIFAANSSRTNDGDFDNMTAILSPLRELQIDCYQRLTQASNMKVLTSTAKGDNDIEDLRLDLIEQSISTLEMAQRGIRNHKIPSSHEVSLECHRLLAVAYSLLRQNFDATDKDEWKDTIDKEICHQEEFFRGVLPAKAILDPSALTIQHQLMANCLIAKLDITEIGNSTADGSQSSDTETSKITSDLQRHATMARKIAVSALGIAHPFVLLQEKQLKLLSGVISKKRKFDASA